MGTWPTSPSFPYTCVLPALCNFTRHLTSHHNRTQDRGRPVTTHTLALGLCASHLSRRQLCPSPRSPGSRSTRPRPSAALLSRLLLYGPAVRTKPLRTPVCWLFCGHELHFSKKYQVTVWVCDRRVLSSAGNHRRFPAAHGSAKCRCTFLTSQPSAPSALGTITAARHMLLLAGPLPRSEVSLRSTPTPLGGPDPTRPCPHPVPLLTQGIVTFSFATLQL